jgi:DHA2 family multidrug resistance protein
MLTRRSEAHETSMVRSMIPGTPGFDANVQSLTRAFKAGNGAGIQGGAYGGASPGAIHQAQGFIYQQMHRQSGALAYVDIIRYLTIFCAVMIPLLFFIPKPPKHIEAGH